MITVIKRNKWEIWRDVIFALFAREIRTGFNDKLGLSWAILNPILFILALSYVRGTMDGGDTHSIPTFLFMAIGMLLIQSFLQTFTSTSTAIKKNKALFAFRQVQPISVVVAAALFELLVKLFVAAGIVVCMYFMKMEIVFDDPLTLFVNVVALWLFASFMGLIFGLLELYVEEVSKIKTMLTRPLFFISGTFFSLQDVPQEYWWLLDWNPILHAIELTRYAAYPSYGNEGVSHSYLFLTVLVCSFFALSLYHLFWKEAVSR